MIIYRLQAHPKRDSSDFIVTWSPTVAASKAVLREVAPFTSFYYLDKVDTGGGRDDLCCLLNLADSSRENLPGELVEKGECDE